MDLSDEIEDVFEGVVEDGGTRVDAWLAARTGRSRSLMARLIDAGSVSIDGRSVTKSHRTQAGEHVRCIIYKESAPDLVPQDVPFGVVLETDRYIIVDKPAGYSVHPSPTDSGPTLVHGLLARYTIDDDHEFRPGIVHRLDKDTSGLLVVAKDRDARERLSAMFADRAIRKFYLAVCRGEPVFTEKRIEERIGRHPVNRKKMAVVDEGGRAAVSLVRVRQRFMRSFLAEVEILTGRTHQIRVHLAHIGLPIIGDGVYGPTGGVSALLPRQALHAARLVFTDPFTGDPVDVSCDLPDDIKALVTALERD